MDPSGSGRWNPYVVTIAGLAVVGMLVGLIMMNQEPKISYFDPSPSEGFLTTQLAGAGFFSFRCAARSRTARHMRGALAA